MLRYLILSTFFVAAMFCAPRSSSTDPAPHRTITTHTGYASYYAEKFDGRKTANGERFSNAQYTAASKELPLGSRVRVTNPQTHRSVVVRINDRGPYVPGRLIDLSRRAAADLGMLRIGVAMVRITILG